MKTALFLFISFLFVLPSEGATAQNQLVQVSCDATNTWIKVDNMDFHIYTTGYYPGFQTMS